MTKSRAKIADAVSYHPETCTSSSKAVIMEIALFNVISVLLLSVVTENASWESEVNHSVPVQ